ncbi:MAG TPA: 5-oxoprolinase subunit PxpA [Candidatus Dormibacteraeota bacterium]|nr:5-oxoprolinase subunit PxpA [Candidatus Dormibacteraeota bacterium]
MNVNSDLGEGAGSDEAILLSIDSANVCCGVHAGSASMTIETARRCAELGVQVGAHPGYDDRENFGRVEVSLTPAEIEELIAFQVAALAAIAPVAYIKPHGALYHRCQRDRDAAGALVRVASRFRIAVMGQPDFEIVAAANRAGIRAYREGFADRRMLADGTLAPRTQPDAVLDAGSAVRQAVALAQTGRYDTLCIHGDTKGAPDIAVAIRKALRDAGIANGRLA